MSREAVIQDRTGKAYFEWWAGLGVDQRGHGFWQDNYVAMVLEAVGGHPRTVLDVGAGAGSITKSFKDAGMTVRAFDQYPYAVGLGWKTFSLTHEELFVGDAADINRVRDGAIDLIHASNVLEHIAEDRLPLVISELNRVSKADAAIWAVHPVKTPDEPPDEHMEDPTHLTIRPREWWNDLFQAGGWVVDPEAYDRFRRSDHRTGVGSLTFYKTYGENWAAFCWRRRSV